MTIRRREGTTRFRRLRAAGAAAGILLGLAIAAGGCTAIAPPRVEAPSLYALATAPLRAAARPKRDAVVEVGAPRAWPGFDTPQIVYVRHTYEIEYYSASRWVDTPARMLAPLVARALEETGSFRAVVDARGGVPADYRFDTELVRLQQSFAERPSRVQLTLRAQLTDVRGKRVVAVRVFDESAAAPTEDAAGGVIAANAALQRALEQLADFCVAESAAR